MQLPIINFVESHNFQNEAEELFYEAARCYRAKAYRAAFVFSYLGFLMVLKYRVLEADRPEKIPRANGPRL